MGNRSFFTSIILLLLAVSMPAALVACPIIRTVPTRTMADRLLEANMIVLAREDAEKPFAYKAHTALKGVLSGEEQIGLFMNSYNRNVLRKLPERSSVLIRFFDGEKQVWELVGAPDPEIELLVKQILEAADSWEADPPARLNFFKERMRHSSSAVRDQAYLEIGRAPYSDIRKMKGVIPSDEIHAFLFDINYMEWHPLQILLLGLSDEPYDQKVIKESFLSATRYGSDTRLSAWTAAYLEFDPEAAFEDIEKAYFHNPDHELADLTAVVTALCIHGSEGQVYLRDRIVAGFRPLLKNYPDLVSLVTEYLIKWQRWDFTDTMLQIMKNPPPTYDTNTNFLLRLYLRSAKVVADKKLD